jgi:hypothetical protein
VELLFLAPPPKWKPQTALGAASGPELLDFKSFVKALAGADFGAGFEALANRP